MVQRFFLTVVLVLGLACGPIALEAHAAKKKKPVMSKEVRTVLRTGLYGAIAGTAVGLATFPFERKVRTVFIGTSAGLYLGLAVGIFLVWESSEPEDYGVPQYGLRPEHQNYQALMKTQPAFYTQATVFRF